MKNKYFVRYKIETPNTVAGISSIGKREKQGYDFILGDDKFIIYDTPLGLTADGHIYGEKIIDAQLKSFGIISELFNLIDFSTSTSSNVPFLDMSYDALKNI